MSKKNDVSNKTLAMLVLAGIAISVIGLFLSTESQGPTGYAVIMNITNVNGSVQLFVNATLVLNLTDANISLSNIEPGATRDSQDMGTQGMGGIGPFAGNADGYAGANVSGDWFNLSNEGGVSINISGYSTASPFSTTTGNANSLSNNPYFQFYANGSGNNSGTGVLNETRGSVQGIFANRTYLVKNLNNLEGKNTVSVGVKVEIPSDEDAGKKQTQINFVAEQHSPGTTA